MNALKERIKQDTLARLRGQGGMGGLFSDSADDFRKKAQAKVDMLDVLVTEIESAMGGYPDNKVIQQQGKSYLSGVTRTIAQTNPDVLVRNFMAGGAVKDGAYKLLDEADRVYSRITEMFEADVKDPSGKTGEAIAKQHYGEAMAESLRREDAAKFWEMGGFGGGVIDFFENLKKYAKWILIGGGILLVAPVVMPFIGRAVGGYKSGHAKSVAANRRRRR